jgi:putative redox protein
LRSTASTTGEGSEGGVEYSIGLERILPIFYRTPTAPRIGKDKQRERGGPEKPDTGLSVIVLVRHLSGRGGPVRMLGSGPFEREERRMASNGVPMTAETGGGFEVKLRHGPSGASLSTQPPKDNGGTGAAFSPTDLVGAALASCALTTMALNAQREGLKWGTASARVEKEMQASPRRIARLTLEVRMPAGVPAPDRARLEEIGRTCPVARSLNADVELPMTFVYPD